MVEWGGRGGGEDDLSSLLHVPKSFCKRHLKKSQ